jgi:hypothetical protein
VSVGASLAVPWCLIRLGIVIDAGEVPVRSVAVEAGGVTHPWWLEVLSVQHGLTPSSASAGAF